MTAVQETTEDHWMTAQEIGAELQLHPKFVLMEVRAGHLKGIKINTRVVRVRRSWLNEYIAANQVTKGAA